jgi:hypothetical protein
MTDFVTKLENELHAAALRRDHAGAVRTHALPRLRLALEGLPATALATVLLGLALAGVAIMLASSPEHAAQGKLPPALNGTWRAGPTELRLYFEGSARCANLGLASSKPCYALGSSATHVAREWGELTVGRGELTFRAAGGGAPGSYRWAVEGGALRLARLRDPMTARASALTSQPLAHPRVRRAKPEVPLDWTARSFTSELGGYSIRYPSGWSAREATTPGKPDRLSAATAGASLPAVTVTSEDLPAGTDAGRWGVIVNSRPELSCQHQAWYRRRSIGGEPAIVSRYLGCNGADEQWATVVHQGRGYTVRWRGKPGRINADGPLFDALLKTLVFAG